MVMNRNESSKAFLPTKEVFVLRLDISSPMPLAELGDFIEDLAIIYRVAAEEYLTITDQPRSLSAELYVREMRGGSLELLTETFASGVLGGVAANAITAIFVRLLRGKKEQSTRIPASAVETEATERAARKARSPISNTRKRVVTFGMSFRISFDKQIEDLLND
jgi:hypothetical protein